MDIVFKKFEKDSEKYIQAIYKKDERIIDIELLLEKDDTFFEITKANTKEYLYSIAIDFKEDLTKVEKSKVLNYINQRNEFINNKIKEYVAHNSSDKVILIKPVGKANYTVIKSIDRYILTSVSKIGKEEIQTNILIEDELDNDVLIEICEEVAKLSYSDRIYIQINEKLFIGILKKEKKSILITQIEFGVKGQQIELSVEKAMLVKKDKISIFNKGIYEEKELRTDVQQLLKCFTIRYL